MQWFKVFVAGFVEVIWVTGIKYSDNLIEWLLTGMFITLSFYLVISACKTLPVGTVYAIFVGMGTLGTILFDFFFTNEPFNITKMVLIIILIVGIVGLKLTSDVDDKEAN
ncbi:DMT family transporter [Staphylococcus massiliensis]|uniref:SMR-type multidrug efflux transporter n=1 Tax=Staphylococcus massiliensis S46 TaxID=1229783 RepID=K9ASF4_9STAP|nr:multidrug efflux SMR transporter [Staphylococcus massiliensis]EKU48976.1 SMR-type multidrug efflux transporter [Staphylococcus massiliensis S46]MCG3399416.1 multidrug efflux SMR transporter [Staphylococcus massiliensis]MCG3402484.1 multidrug efflux SMR transporter [Staphylococcus massiliensis]MCG3411552.1 multidrug efflux SMR transporter [Staphylococcus massiliensis]PNZ98713.1 QacE family quaternary ammonium compound efflux SMR transporter [Staphylococcus massiliensis CCUG 55927]